MIIRLGVTLAASLTVAACAGRETVPNPGRLTVDYSWDGTPACVATSPALRIGDAPAATARYAVRLADLNVLGFAHGGGEVARPPNDIIPAGALAEGYRGPCPPGRHNYRFSVDAVDAQNRIIATGEAVRAFPP